MTKAIIYSRQSKHKDDTISHDIQIASCRAYAEGKGYEVAEVLIEEGISGRTVDKRPEFLRALDLIETGKAEVLLVHKWSRMSRNVLNGLLVLNQVSEAGGRVECSTEPIPEGPSGKLAQNLLLTMAEQQSDEIKSRWHETHQLRVDRGLPPRRASFPGYERIKDKEGERWEPDDSAPFLVEATERVARGESHRQVAFWLNDSGIKTTRGGHWESSTLRRALHSPFLRGLIEHDGKEFPGAHQAIISEGLWRKYRAQVAENKGVPKRSTPKHRLAGLLTCAKCGYGLGMVNRKGFELSIRCLNRARNGSKACSKRQMPIKPVDDVVSFWLPRHWKVINETIPVEDLAKELADVEGKITTLQEKIKNTLLLGEEAGLSHEELVTALQGMKAELEALKGEQTNIQTRISQQGKAWWAVEDIITGDDVVAARDMIRQVVEKITVSDESVTITPKTGKAYTYNWVEIAARFEKIQR